MSKEKSIQNRLDDLFSELENQTVPTTTTSDKIPGWTWECDPQGIYTDCGPEVEHFIGLSPIKFIGQSLFTFLLDAHSETNLRDIFTNGDFPHDLLLKYKAYYVCTLF